MDYSADKRIVMTLDAGGTNFVFSAIQANKEIVAPLRRKAFANELEPCLKSIISGFETIKKQLYKEPVAISFAFPGPADYPNGIIRDLQNLPAFRGGVALGPMLEEHFLIPTFINNDGDLFTLGEAVAGFLPWINGLLEKHNISKRYKVLLGITLGTGFGGGIVREGQLFIGDNSGSGEIYRMRNKLEQEKHVEEGASIRAVKKIYSQLAKIPFEDCPEPDEIFRIALGELAGSKISAIKAFERLGEVVGDALANAITLIDGMVVLGGGLSGAASLFLPKIVCEMNSSFHISATYTLPRVACKVFNLENRKELIDFIKGNQKKITIPGTRKTIAYDPNPRIGIGLSRLGTSRAISIGAYNFALNKLDHSKSIFN